MGVCGKGVRERDASERDCTAFPHTPMEEAKVLENAGESGVPAAHEPQDARRTIAEAEALAAYEDAEVAAGGWLGHAPPARVPPEVAAPPVPAPRGVDELAIAAWAEGHPLALCGTDPLALAIPRDLSPELAAEVRASTHGLCLLLGRWTPTDSDHEWPEERRGRYRGVVEGAVRAGVPWYLAERAAAWWVWEGPWPERAPPYAPARARGAA